MNITYENGNIIVTHNTGIVISRSYDDYVVYVERKTLRLAERQDNLEKAKATLALIEASKTNSTPTT